MRTSGLSGAFIVSEPESLPTNEPALTVSQLALTPLLCLRSGLLATTPLSLSRPGRGG